MSAFVGDYRKTANILTNRVNMKLSRNTLWRRSFGLNNSREAVRARISTEPDFQQWVWHFIKENLSELIVLTFSKVGKRGSNVKKNQMV